MKFFDTPMGKLLLAYEENKKLEPVLGRSHALTKPLVVSLTSYLPRFNWLHLTLGSILEQDVKPDQIVLWVSDVDHDKIPDRVKNLSPKICIRKTRDIRSYKKLIPALSEYPECYLAICDDDIYYPRDWLESLISDIPDYAINGRVLHRFHKENNHVAPYCDWSFDVQDTNSRSGSLDLLPVGVGGVLFPPNCFHEDVARMDLIQEICPRSDDLWFFAMSRMMGYLPRKVGRRLHPILWPGSQDCGLHVENMFKFDDLAVQALMNRYGQKIFSTSN